MKIPLVDLHAQREFLRAEIVAAVAAVLARGDIILGEEVRRFDDEFARWLGVIGVDAEVVVKATQRGFRCAELEVGYLPRTTGRSTGDRPRNVIITVLQLLVLFWRVRVRGVRT